MDRADQELSLEHLDKVLSVQVILDTHDKRTRLAYFLDGGKVYRIDDVEILKRSLKELEHIHYLLEVKNETTRNWSESLKRTVSNKRKHSGKGSKGEYIPKYLTYQNEEKEMVRNSAKLEIFLNRKHLIFTEDGMKT